MLLYNHFTQNVQSFEFFFCFLSIEREYISISQSNINFEFQVFTLREEENIIISRIKY